MKRLLNESEYLNLYSHRTNKFSIGNNVGILTKVVGEYNSYSLTDGVITGIDSENSIFLIKVGSSELAIKLIKNLSQVILGRVSKYETSLINLNSIPNEFNTSDP